MKENFYQNIIFNLSDGYAHGEIIFDDDGNAKDWRYLEINPAFEKQTGIDWQSVEGKLVSEVFKDEADTFEDLVEIFGEVAKNDKGKDFEYFFKPLQSWFNIRAESYSQNQFIAVFNNITDKKEKEKEFEQLFNATQIGISYQNKDGKILKMNPACEEILGLSMKQMLGAKPIDPLWRCIHPDGSDYPGEIHPGMLSLSDGKDRANEEMGIFNPQKGSFTWINIKTTVIWEKGKISGVVATFEDITDEFNYRKELQKLNNRLKHTNFELQQFAYAASHDLQEPIRTISALIGMFKSKYKSTIDPKAIQLMDIIESNSIRIRQMINDILKYASHSSETDNYEKIKLSELLKEAESNLGQLMFSNKAKVNLKQDLLLKTDPLLLRRLLENLMSNAIKYNRSSQPLITIDSEIEEENFILLVADNGIGMTDSQKERAFELFKRFNEDEEVKGTGIGLSICKKIISNFGGDIEIEDNPEGGTIFKLFFPKVGLVTKL